MTIPQKKSSKAIINGFIFGIAIFQIFCLIQTPEILTDQLYYNPKSPLNKYDLNTTGTVNSIMQFPKSGVQRKLVKNLMSDFRIKYNYEFEDKLFEGNVNINLDKFTAKNKKRIIEELRSLYELKIKIDPNNPDKSYVIIDDTFKLNA